MMTIQKGLMMTREELLHRISIDPNVCFGHPCIRGTRIWVSAILDNLAEGSLDEDIFAAYPKLTKEDIRAAVAYGAEKSRERILPIPVDHEYEVQIGFMFCTHRLEADAPQNGHHFYNDYNPAGSLALFDSILL